MKALLVSEGKHELSQALPTLLRRVIHNELQFDSEKVSKQGLHAHHGKGQGYFKRAIRWLLEAKRLGYEAMVLVIDEDGYGERVKEIADAQQYSGCSVRRAMGVAIRSFDAWMLADESALTQALDCPINRQPTPEGISDPKAVCVSLRDDSGAIIGLTDLYGKIAYVVNIEALETRCSKGFAPFAQRLRAL